MKSVRAEIARITGFCEATISFALNGHPRVKDETRKRVLKVAHELGYTPNRPARRLAQSRFKKNGKHAPEHIGFIVFCDVETQLFEMYTKILLGAEFEVSKCQLPLYFIRIEPQSDTKRIEMLGFEDVDAWLLTGNISPEMLNIIKAWKKPFVIIGENQSTTPVNHVDCDYKLITKQSIEILSNAGHKQIAIYLGGLQYNYQQQLLSGYETSIKEQNIPINKNLILHDKLDVTRKLSKITSGETQPTALIIAEPNRSGDVISELIHGGIKIPENTSIITVESGPIPHTQVKDITHHIIPFSQLGASAVTLLV